MQTLFHDRPHVLKVLQSRSKEQSGEWKRIDGPYTAAGHNAVRRRIHDYSARLTEERWVVPRNSLEVEPQVRAYKRLWQDYQTRYIEEWTDFLKDIRVRPVKTSPERAQVLKTLASPEWPYLRLLVTLQAHTQQPSQDPFVKPKSDGEKKDKSLAELKARGRDKLRRDGVKGLDLERLDLKETKRDKPIRDAFASLVGFGVAANGGSKTGLAECLEFVRSAGAKLLAGSAVDWREVRSNTWEQLLKVDERGQQVLKAWLLDPLGGRPIR